VKNPPLCRAVSPALQVTPGELAAETPAGAGDQDALCDAGGTAAGRRRPPAAHGRLRAGGCPWVGMASAVGAAVIARPVAAWVGMRSSGALAAGALGGGAAAVAGAGAGSGAGGGVDTGGSGAGAGSEASSGFGGSGFDAGGGAIVGAALTGAVTVGGGAAGGAERGARSVAGGRSTGGAGAVGLGRGFATAGVETAGGAGDEGVESWRESGPALHGTPYECR
jgi:hypothetical protein